MHEPRSSGSGFREPRRHSDTGREQCGVQGSSGAAGHQWHTYGYSATGRAGARLLCVLRHPLVDYHASQLQCLLQRGKFEIGLRLHDVSAGSESRACRRPASTSMGGGLRPDLLPHLLASIVSSPSTPGTPRGRLFQLRTGLLDRRASWLWLAAPGRARGH